MEGMPWKWTIQERSQCHGCVPELKYTESGFAMSGEDVDFAMSRRRLLQAAGLGGFGLLATPLLAEGADAVRGDAAKVPPVTGLHLQFGDDASFEMVVSWISLEPVANPRVLLGHRDG